MADTAPTGIITLFFTDMQDSAALWERIGDRFRPVLAHHNDLIRERVQRWNGYEVKNQGDSFMVAFRSGTDAVACALEVQRALAETQWLPEVGELRVRIGIHTGEPFLGYDPTGRPDYLGPVVNRASRVTNAGHGGQILISSATREAVEGVLTPDTQLIDHGFHRLRGLEEMEHLWEVRHSDLALSFPPLRSLNPEGHNLPLPPAPFIGREQEIRAWCELLRQPTTRLLTLVGLGGMGKTRAALQLAELCAGDFAGEFPNGVWWVELEETRSGGEMGYRIASRLHLALQPQPSVEEQLRSFLRERQLLLVLDNTEQNPDAAGVVNELLRVAPRLKCLVTTRRALALRAEQIVEVPPLPVPDGGAPLAGALPSQAGHPGTRAKRGCGVPLQQYPSVVLFVDRARARNADFSLTDDNAGDVAELCCRLEGVPLAIELAASRIVGMTPHEILNRLTERFRLLQTRSPDPPPRHRALRGAMDWSYDLLTDDDKELFAQLAVFAGGFTLADAEAVCDAQDVLEGVMELRRCSLLCAETDSTTQQTRFFMLESVREYAIERWGGELTGEWGALRRRHAEHFLRVAERQAAQEHTAGESAALRAMERSFDNVRAALLWTHHWAVSQTGPTRDAAAAVSCARLALALGWFLEMRSFWQVALPLSQMALDTLEPESPIIHRASLLCLQASLHHDLGALPVAGRCAQESLTAFRQLNDDHPRFARAPGAARALNLLGLIARREGKPDEAQAHFEESLRLHRALGHAGWAAGCLSNLGLLAEERGERDTAFRLFAESLALSEDVGDQRGIAAAKNNLGILAFEQGAFAEARRCYADALHAERDLGSRSGIATALHNLGEVAEGEGDADRAARYFSAAQRLFAEIGSPLATYAAEALTRLGRSAEAVNIDEVIAMAGV